MRYEAPQTVEQAAAFMAAPGARALSGGTDLLAQMRVGRLTPDVVVDLKRIPELIEITEEMGGFRIGSGVSSAAMSEHAALSKAWPGVCEAAALIGSTQIQGRATLAGNLCNGSPAADSVPAMIAAGATARIIGAGGRRDVLVADLPIGPGKLALEPGEFVASIFLPAPAPRSADAYLRFIPRTEMDIAVVGAAVWLTLDETGAISDARVALGAVAPTARLVADAAAALVGSRCEPEALDAAGAAASAACAPIDDKRGTVEYRIDVAGVLTKRAAKIAYQRAGGAA